MERVDVAILGGGVSGLSAGWALRRAGVEDFVLLEMEDAAGGTSRSMRGAVSAFPLGAHYLPVPSQEAGTLCELLRELDVLRGFDAAGRAICGEEHLCRAPQERIYYKGRWYEGLYLRAGASAEDLRQLDRFHAEIGRWVQARDGQGRRAFSLPQRRGSYLAGGAVELDRLSMAAYLDRLGLTSPRLRWQVDYACRDDFGLTIRQASALAGVHYYAARLLHKDDTPPEVLTWPEGNGYLVGRMAERLGERVKTGCMVVDVRPLPGPRGEVEVLYQRGAGGPILGLVARAVVFALPVFLRRHLIAPLRGGGAGWMGAFSYAPWLVANLTLRRPPPAPVAAGMKGWEERPGYPQCWDNVLYESPALGYVVATHQREAALPADGVPRSAWTYYMPLCGLDARRSREWLLRASHETLAEMVLRDLAVAEPGLLGQVERVDVTRWGHGMVRPVVGLLSGGALAEAAAPLQRIHFAHTDLAGMALFEEAHAAGVAAAEAAAAQLGATG
jgi:hypothetical protein